MKVDVSTGKALTLTVSCRGVVVQTYRFMMIKPGGEHVEVRGSNTQSTAEDSHAHTFDPPIPAGTQIHGVLSYTTTGGEQPFVAQVDLRQDGKVLANSLDKDDRSTSAEGVAARFVDYEIGAAP